MTDDRHGDGGGFAGRDHEGIPEYRDLDLALAFSADPVPDHGPNFWIDLQAELDRIPNEDMAQSMEPTTVIELSAVQGSRRPPGRLLLAVAAASLALVGLSLFTYAYAGNSDSPITAADVAADSETVTPPMSSTSTTSPPTTAGETDTSVPDQALPALPVDYFGRSNVTAIGSGLAVGFSPDDSSVLVVDEADGSELGCEAAPLLALYAQDLASGVRRPALPSGMLVETGGLELLMPAPAPPDGSASREVFWTEYCDGVRSATWSGTMAPDGTISGVETAVTEGLGDPFNLSGMPSASAVGAYALTSDLSLGLFLDGEVVVVRSIDPNSDLRWQLPDQDLARSVTAGAWDPTGQVIALVSADATHLWNFRTGELSTVATPGVRNAMFDHGGRRLALNIYDGTSGVSVLSFGDSAKSVPAVRPCSGQVDLEPLTVESLVAAGLPDGIASLVVSIDAAAATCDWAALERLTAEDFSASFGGGDAIELWRAGESRGGVMGVLRTVLRQPFGMSGTAEDGLYAWPEVFLRESCDYSESDLQSLSALGYDENTARSDCELIGGYIGYRTGIDSGGNWIFFIAGD